MDSGLPTLSSTSNDVNDSATAASSTILNKNAQCGKKVLLKDIYGTIESYNVDRGFGFIRQSSGTPLIFFHRSNMPNVDPLPGTSVKFDVSKRPKGRLEALNILHNANHAKNPLKEKVKKWFMPAKKSTSSRPQ